MYDHTLPESVTSFMEVLHNLKSMLDFTYPISNPTRSEVYNICKEVYDFVIKVSQLPGAPPPPDDKMSMSFGIATAVWGSKRRKRYYIPSGSIQEHIDQIEISGIISDIVTGFNDHDFECGSIIPEIGYPVHYAYTPWVATRFSPNEVFEDENTSSIMLTSNHGTCVLDPSVDVDFYFDILENENMVDMLITFLQLVKYRKQYPDAMKVGVPKFLKKTFKKPKSNHIMLKHYLDTK